MCEQEKAELDKAFEEFKAAYDRAKPYFGATGSVVQGFGVAAVTCFVAGFTFGKGRQNTYPKGYDPTDAPVWGTPVPPLGGYPPDPVGAGDIITAPNLGCVAAIGNAINTNEQAREAWNDFWAKHSNVQQKHAAYTACMNSHKNIPDAQQGTTPDAGGDETGDTGNDGVASTADLPE